MAAFAAFTLSLVLSNAVSAELDQDWYISPTFSYITTDNSRLDEDDEGNRVSLAVGKEINNNINLELDLGHSRLNRLDKSHYAQTGLDLDALYFLNKDARFAPYVTAGLGIIFTEQSGNDDTNPTWGGGFGALTKLGSGSGLLENASLRTEVRFQQEVDSGEWAHDDVLYTVGLNFPLGKKAAPVPVKPMVKDTDGDGVNDADDKCPATPAGTAVNSFGCKIDGDSDRDGVKDSMDRCPNTPRGVAVDSNGCKVDGDSDNDGVKDSMDQCPNTAPGTVVDSRGCPVDPDSDNDGVPDSKDQCPNSAPGVRIDFKGCEIRDVISLPGINFEVNSAQLTSSSAATLDGAAETLNKFTDITAQVAGHTDSTGADSYNMSLSGKRAQAVKEYLISRGVAASRLSSQGYGETQPIADNSSKDGRAMNRRVELNVVK